MLTWPRIRGQISMTSPRSGCADGFCPLSSCRDVLLDGKAAARLRNSSSRCWASSALKYLRRFAAMRWRTPRLVQCALGLFTLLSLLTLVPMICRCTCNAIADAKQSGQSVSQVLPISAGTYLRPAAAVPPARAFCIPLSVNDRLATRT